MSCKGDRGVFGAGGAVPGVAQGAHGAGIDHPVQSLGRGRGQQLPGAFHVDGVHGGRVRHPEAVVRGHVKEAGAAREGAVKRIRVPEVAFGHVHGQAGQGRMIRVAGQDPHLPAGGQEFLHHGPAHEAGTAGHQGFTRDRFSVFGFRFSGGDEVMLWSQPMLRNGALIGS